MGFQLSPHNRKKRFSFVVVIVVCLLAIEAGIPLRERPGFILGYKVMGVFDIENSSLQA